MTLVPIDAQRFPSWWNRSLAEYATDLTSAGEAPEVARRHAAETMRTAFPTGGPAADNAVFDLVHDADGTVGYLWIGRDTSDDATAWWVWDILIEPEHRGKGYGRAAMLLAEDHARATGARTLGLSVFGHNRAARALYESAGFEITTVKMRKRL